MEFSGCYSNKEIEFIKKYVSPLYKQIGLVTRILKIVNKRKYKGGNK